MWRAHGWPVGEVLALGSRLRQRREELGLTQAQAARELAVARTAYRLWEMEAARPAPDRWRTIAQWLGISMSALLLAEELLDHGEASEAAAAESGMPAGTNWDRVAAASDGDYFSQERAMIAEQKRTGTITADQATDLRRVLTRIQLAASDHAAVDWHPGTFAKRFSCDPFAPMLARTALTATAVGIPPSAMDDAVLLVSELVTNSVRHSGCASVDVAISLSVDAVRIEVSDADPTPIRPQTPGLDGGFGLTFVAALATRWGVERQAAGKTIWVEIDLANRA